MATVPNPEDLIKRAERMKSDRSTFESHWREINDYLYPDGDQFIETTTPGAKLRQKVLDNTGEQAGEQLTAALGGLGTNPATDWMGLRAVDDGLNRDRDVSIWLADASARMLNVFRSARSGFQPNQHEKNLDLVYLGSAGMFIPDVPTVGPVFRTYPLPQLYFDENHEGRVDTVYRWYKLTARQAVQQWGKNVGVKVGAAAETANRQDELFEFLHCVEPRTDRDPGKIDRLNKPIQSAAVSVADKHLIEIGGFDEMPYATPRWIKRSNEKYGRGPGMKALADVKMLQRMMKATVRGAEKAINPSLMVPDDGVIGPVRMTDNGLTVVRADMMQMAGGPIRPLITGGRPDIGEEIMRGVRDRIDSAFFAHLIKLSQDPRMTATQVLELAETSRIQLGPMFGRLEGEDYGPTVERTFAVMFRAGMFLPMPEKLAGAPIRVEYLSPIAKAQKLQIVRSVFNTLDVIDRMTPYNPDVKDNFDFDDASLQAADALGWPKSAIRGPERVRAIRDAKAEVAEEQAQRQDILDGAEVLKKATPLIQDQNQQREAA